VKDVMVLIQRRQLAFSITQTPQIHERHFLLYMPSESAPLKLPQGDQLDWVGYILRVSLLGADCGKERSCW